MKRFLQIVGSGCVAFLIAGCGDHGNRPRQTSSLRVAADNPDVGGLWPALLQNCLRNPSCDPAGEFSEGAGHASGTFGLTTWLAETADVVSEGGADYGARIRLSMHTYRGEGGVAGRLLTPDEMPKNLRTRRYGRSRLTVEYRMPFGDPAAYFLSFRSPLLALEVPGAEVGARREDRIVQTDAMIDGWIWPDGGEGAKVELRLGDEVVLSGYSPGMAADVVWTEDQVAETAIEPWVFLISRLIRNDEPKALMAALKSDVPLKVTISAPGGGIIFEDVFGVGGYENALSLAELALGDVEIQKPLTERCAPYVGWSNDEWAVAEVSPAQASCDPLTNDERERILQSSAAVGVDGLGDVP